LPSPGLTNNVMRSGLNGFVQGFALSKLFYHRVSVDGAGHPAQVVTAHTVSDQPQTKVGLSAVGVFVVLTTKTDMGSVPKLNHSTSSLPITDLCILQLSVFSLSGNRRLSESL